MKYYGIAYNEEASPSNDKYVLHIHENYEVLFFLDGDTNYVVDGRSYSLEPGDVMVVRKHQLHRAYHNSPKEYKRIVLYLYPEFFQKYECPEYEEIFINESLKRDSKIPAELVKKSGLFDALMRFSRYTDSFKAQKSPIYVSCLMEILYLLSGLTDFSEAEATDSHFCQIAEYINEHFTEDMPLAFLSDMFSLSRYHLCRIFKQKTGMTIHQYVNKKRFAKVRDFVKAGMSITEAALAAGYESYSAFYRVFVKEFGQNPREGLKEIDF